MDTQTRNRQQFHEHCLHFFFFALSVKINLFLFSEQILFLFVISRVSTPFPLISFWEVIFRSIYVILSGINFECTINTSVNFLKKGIVNFAFELSRMTDFSPDHRKIILLELKLRFTVNQVINHIIVYYKYILIVTVRI